MSATGKEVSKGGGLRSLPAAVDRISQWRWVDGRSPAEVGKREPGLAGDSGYTGVHLCETKEMKDDCFHTIQMGQIPHWS